MMGGRFGAEPACGDEEATDEADRSASPNEGESEVQPTKKTTAALKT